VDSSSADWASEVRRATDGRGVDVLLESSGGDSLAQGLSALALFGWAVVYGAASGVNARLDAAMIERLFYAPAPNQSLAAFNLGGWFIDRPQRAGAALGELLGLVAAGAIHTPPLTCMKLQDAAHAHHLLETRQTAGKLVRKPW
jgi:NADPH:quinone reductase